MSTKENAGAPSLSRLHRGLKWVQIRAQHEPACARSNAVILSEAQRSRRTCIPLSRSQASSPFKLRMSASDSSRNPLLRLLNFLRSLPKQGSSLACKTLDHYSNASIREDKSSAIPQPSRKPSGASSLTPHFASRVGSPYSFGAKASALAACSCSYPVRANPSVNGAFTTGNAARPTVSQ